jgi:hypothetical protein
MANLERLSERWVVRASIAGLFVVLSFLAGPSLVLQRETTRGAAPGPVAA